MTTLVAALAFSAPPSLSRRDMVFGASAAAAAMIPSSPAFARPEDYAGSADRKKKAKEDARIAALGPDYKSPYQKIMESSAKREAAEAAANEATMKAAYGDLAQTGNGKDKGGVSYRKPSDPNACSAECKEKRLKKYGYGA